MLHHSFSLREQTGEGRNDKPTCLQLAGIYQTSRLHFSSGMAFFLNTSQLPRPFSSRNCYIDIRYLRETPCNMFSTSSCSSFCIFFVNIVYVT